MAQLRKETEDITVYAHFVGGLTFNPGNCSKRGWIYRLVAPSGYDASGYPE